MGSEVLEGSLSFNRCVLDATVPGTAIPVPEACQREGGGAREVASGGLSLCPRPTSKTSPTTSGLLALTPGPLVLGLMSYR